MNVISQTISVILRISAIFAVVIFSPGILAQQARLQGSLLTLPVVDTGRQLASMEFRLIDGTFPIEFELTYSEFTRGTVTLNTPYFLDDLLVIPVVSVKGLSYWAELREIGFDQFRLESYGPNRSVPPTPAPDSYNFSNWQRLPGEAHDIGVGANGSVWVLGADEYDEDYGIYHWDGYGWQEFYGSGVRLDVAPDGTPWIINHHGEIYTLNHGLWQRISGEATDIGIGADGSVWALGGREHQGDYDLYHLGRYGWERVDGSGVRVDVDSDGNPWVINDDEEIYRFTNGFWTRIPGEAKDISIGADGSVWVIGANHRAGGYGIYRFNGAGWTQVDGSARQISVGPDGQPWVVNREGEIYYRNTGY